VLIVSRSPERITDWIMALAIASTITLLLLLAADRIARHIGRRGLSALDRMMGLVLTAIAVEMLLKGIESFVRGL
jgi:small neutral amino acid transporter SnatA (MarC family)